MSTIIIISYRQECECRCGRKCLCEKCSSDLAIHVAQTEEEAADFIADRLWDNQDAYYNNYIFDRWEDVVALGRVCTAATKGDFSIEIPFTDNEYDAEIKRKNEMLYRIRNMVKNKLAKLTADKNRKEQDKLQHEQEVLTKKKMEEDRAIYESLKSQFEK